MSQFNLQKDLLTIKKDLDGGQAELMLTPKEIDKKLNKFEDVMSDSPLNILAHFDDIKTILTGLKKLSPNAQVKFLGLLSNGLRKLANLIEVCLRSNNMSEQIEMKASLEGYCYFLLSATMFLDSVSERDVGKKAAKSGGIDWDHIKLQTVESVRSLFSMQLSRLFESRIDAESVVSCGVKLLHAFLEQPESVKINGMRSGILEAFASAVKEQCYSHGMKTIILQDLNYFDHLAEYSADLLHAIATKYDDQQFLEDILKDISNLHFGTNETAAARIIADFLEHFSAVSPRLTIRHLSYIVTQLDSESHTIRMAILQVLGNIIKHITGAEDRTDQSTTQTKSLFAVLEERFRDVNSFVRARLLHVLGDLCRSHAIPVNRRSKIVALTIDRVMDKSSNVRKKAVQLLGDLVRAHPFGVDGGELDLEFFQSRLAAIDAVLTEQSNVPEISLLTSPGTDELVSAPQSLDQSNAPQINALLMQKKYYSDAVKFVQQIDKVVPVLLQLLSSNIKTEVFEVMDFFVDIFSYKLRSAHQGIRKMVHLVWEKDLSTEDGTKRSVKDHLVECYRRIYLEADDRLAGKDKILAIANGLLEYANRG